MNNQGYYTQPCLSEREIVFVSEEDLWSVPIAGGRPFRLTSGLGVCRFPQFSPDGKEICFLSSEEGPSQVYKMSSSGGEVERLSYFDSEPTGLRWEESGIYFSSDHNSGFYGDKHFYLLNSKTGNYKALDWGHGSFSSVGPEKGQVVINRLGFNTLDTEPSYWKRYRGGTAGDLWIRRGESEKFERLLNLDGNLGRPLWIADRIFFISDHENVGNIYSCNIQGEDLKTHTHSERFYVRNINSYGDKIVYHAGADLFIFDIKTEQSSKIDIDYRSPKTQTNRKFISAEKNFDSLSFEPKSQKLALASRGRIFSLPLWYGAVDHEDINLGERHRLPCYVNEAKTLCYVVDVDGEEYIEHRKLDSEASSQRIQKSFGKINEIIPHPKKERIYFTNHKNEIWEVDLESGESNYIDREEFMRVESIDLSPDGRWLAYTKRTNGMNGSIWVYSIEEKKSYKVTPNVGLDKDPHFGPEGKYLYFISYKEFNPVYDSLHFDLGFPRGGRPYVLTLQQEVPSLFGSDYQLKKIEEAAKEEKDSEADEKAEESKQGDVKEDSVKDKDSSKKDEARSEGESEESPDEKEEFKVEIDFDGIYHRQEAFPVDDGKYFGIVATKDRVFFGLSPVLGTLDEGDSSDSSWLESFDLKKQKEENWTDGISAFEMTSDRKQIIVYRDSSVRFISSSEKPEEKDSAPGPQSGYLDFSRIQMEVSPRDDWRQMFREAWRLQRDHFWKPDMSDIGWDKVYEAYLPLLDRISCRRELNDLLWEMQGELGASHAYTRGGELRRGPHYRQGFLGARFLWNNKESAYEIKSIFSGYSWSKRESSPLLRAGVQLSPGDFLLSINDRRLNESLSPEKVLSSLGGKEVRIRVKKQGEMRDYNIKTLVSEKDLLYRQWVEDNRKYVHDKSEGLIGYVHVPDMVSQGYSEFHRSFLQEVDKEGLIIDVRFNGGGHVSGLLLEKLARKRIGYGKSRWSGIESYPDASPDGPMVALTNEFAGSDGDIFSHSFKLMGLGPLIGKRTWGGVIGIWPSYELLDGGGTTQPEFAFWFKDVGWNVENYGTDPDIEVENLPEDETARRDAQLDRAIEEVLLLHKKNPPQKPDFSEFMEKFLNQ